MHDTPESNNLKDLLPVLDVSTVGQAVNARDLHKALRVGRDFSTWLKQRLLDLGAIENRDYVVLDGSPDLVTGGLEYNNSRIEYAITLDIAKHLAMLEKNEVGQAIRQYFINLEKHRALALPFDPHDPVSVLEYALGKAKAASTARRELEVAKPKVQAFEQLMDAGGTMSLSQVAKVLGTGVVRLCAALRDAGVLMHDQPNWNVPYQRHVDAGRFEIKVNTVEIKGRDAPHDDDPRDHQRTRVHPEAAGAGACRMTPAATPQPTPKPGSKTVLPGVLCQLDLRSNVDQQIHADLVARAKIGKEKYGTMLETNNGRDALIDLQQEALDAVMYAHQYEMECNTGEDWGEWAARHALFVRALELARAATRMVRARGGQ
ncbi:MAG: hypothetical protein HC933_06550 [Pleurocapsa sp. SU_196_0]|nr:hypothetical protein [Pleurocapsa sp. SU_196_0]